LFAAHVDQYIYLFADAGDNLEKICDHEHSRYPFVAISSTLPATLHVSVSSLSSCHPRGFFFEFPMDRVVSSPLDALPCSSLACFDPRTSMHACIMFCIL
jgi:hypothetical protein